MYHIKIIGAGQIGSRHLQALTHLKHPLSIEVIDPSSTSLDTAQKRYHEMGGNAQHEVNFSQSLKLNQFTDVAIIATSANTRKEVLLNLLDNTHAKYIILEKILFTNETDYFEVGQKLKNSETKVWVNCCMRMIPYYKELKPLFINTPVQYSVEGSNYGLITNAIHYLDHLVYLSGCSEFTVETHLLDDEIIPSKRNGFIEVTGTLLAKFTNGNVAFMTSHATGNAPIQVQISNNKNRIISREWQQLAFQAQHQNNWQWQEVPAPIPFQSQLTTQLIENLIENATCDLPNYTESSKIHLQLLNPLKKFLLDKNIRGNCDFPFT